MSKRHFLVEIVLLCLSISLESMSEMLESMAISLDFMATLKESKA